MATDDNLTGLQGVQKLQNILHAKARQWLTRKHKAKSEKYVRFSDAKLWEQYGLVRLAPTTKGFAWAKA